MYKGIYGSIERDLLEVNFFRNRKKEAMEKMSLPRAVELYYGVIKQFCSPGPKNCRRTHIINIFNTIEDWFLLDSAIQYCEANRTLEKEFILTYGYWTALRMLTRRTLKKEFDSYICNVVKNHNNSTLGMLEKTKKYVVVPTGR